MTSKEKEIYTLVKNELIKEIIPPEYGDNKIDHPMYGHCHHAALTMYILLGGKDQGYKLQKAIDNDGITQEAKDSLDSVMKIYNLKSDRRE